LTKLLFWVTIQAVTEKGVMNIAYVRIDETEPLEKALKRFKRMVEKEGIIREWKKREYFEKPSTIRNKKRKAFERKLMKKVRKMQAMRNY
jgi:small subunit ribosomal protein S21